MRNNSIVNNNITKNSLAKAILYETGIPISIAQNILDSLFENIITYAANDGSVKIPKFGSFYIKNKQARVGRNLNTQASVVINARKVVSFHPSNQLKQAVNESSKPPSN